MRTLLTAMVALSVFSVVGIAKSDPIETEASIDRGSSASSIDQKSLIKTQIQPFEILFKLKASQGSQENKTFKANPPDASAIGNKYGLFKIRRLGGNSSQNTNAFSAKNGSNNVKSKKTRLEIFKAEINEGEDVDALVDMLSQDPDVEWAEINRTLEPHVTTPNDADYSKMVDAMNSTNVSQIWDFHKGSENIVIGIIDTGVDYTHPDLMNNIWINENEIPNDGIDNDNNGYIDDIRGWDFVSLDERYVHSSDDQGPADNDPMDVVGHGTHVSGIAAAEGNNGIGVAGVSWNSKIMPLRAGYKNTKGIGSLSSSAVAEALVYACDNGADIINMSFGNIYPSEAILESVNICADRGVLMVASAGNNGTTDPNYPAAFNKVFAVAAGNKQSTKLSSFSNHGIWVDIAAPGSGIYSTTVGGSYGSKSGTSMASPFVAGLAALIKSQNPTITNSYLRDLLRNMALLPNDEGVNKIGGGFAYLKWPLDSTILERKASVVALSISEDSLQQDHFFDPGERIILKPTVRNFSVSRERVELQLTSADPWIQIDDGKVVLGDIQPNIKETSWNDLFGFSVLENCPKNHIATFEIKMIVDGGPSNITAHSVRLNQRFLSLHDDLPVDPNTRLEFSTLFEHSDGRISHLYRHYSFSEGKLYHRIRNVNGAWSSIAEVSRISNVSGGNYFKAIMDENDEIHVVFETTSDSIEYAHYNGEWSNAIVSEQESGYVLYPEILKDEKSNLLVTWVNRDSTAYSLRAAYFSGGQWSQPRTLMTSNDFSMTSINAVNGVDGNVWMFLTRRASGELDKQLILAKWNFGETFTPIQFETIERFVSSTSDLQGNIHITYRDANGAMVHQVHDGISWGETLPLPQSGKLKVAPTGEVYFVYRDWVDKKIKRKNFINGVWSGSIDLFQLIDLEDFSPEYRQGEVLLTANNEFILSIVNERNYGKSSINLYSTERFDALLPVKLMPTDEGNTTQSSEISASVDLSSVGQLEHFQYAIGTAPGHSDFLKWTSGSLNSELLTIPKTTASDELQPGQDYYFSTRTMTASGYQSAVASSDGITYLSVAPSVIMSSPTDGTTLASSTQTFSWNHVDGALGYALLIGTLGEGSDDLDNILIDDGATTSATVNGLPNDGRTLFVTLSAFTGDAQLSSAHYTYQAYNLPEPEILSPQNGSTFNSDSVVFSWKAIPESSGYSIRVGSTQGGDDIANLLAGVESTSITISGLPTDGRTVHVRISSFPNGILRQRDYVYTAYKALESPTLEVDFNSFWFGSTTTLTWEGAEAVDVYRNNSLYASNTTQNPLTISRWFNSTRYDWKVCLPGTDICSETQR